MQQAVRRLCILQVQALEVKLGSDVLSRLRMESQNWCDKNLNKQDVRMLASLCLELRAEAPTQLSVEPHCSGINVRAFAGVSPMINLKNRFLGPLSAVMIAVFLRFNASITQVMPN